MAAGARAITEVHVVIDRGEFEHGEDGTTKHHRLDSDHIKIPTAASPAPIAKF